MKEEEKKTRKSMKNKNKGTIPTRDGFTSSQYER